jgi:peptidyl-Lys metalloendopeptidase
MDWIRPIAATLTLAVTACDAGTPGSNSAGTQEATNAESHRGEEFASTSVVPLTEEPACQGTELQSARASLEAAKRGLDLAIVALDRPTNADMQRIQTWLNIRNSAEAQAVRQTLTRSRAFADGATFRCAVRSDARLGDYYAYVRPDRAFVIVLGAFFFTAPNQGFESKPGILVHEMTHFTLAGDTQDPRIYGPAEARNLARTSPADAQRNAENLEYFVESVAFAL